MHFGMACLIGTVPMVLVLQGSMQFLLKNLEARQWISRFKISSKPGIDRDGCELSG
ncbi:hypothetical protein GGE24_003261 [Bradyrhizobium centrosematis]|nr:hypothetical protein [Bradyrhizobium centrosematis]MCS3773949.1 hypothetical protein [Bradyrhizobium centrosematis]